MTRLLRTAAVMTLAALAAVLAAGAWGDQVAAVVARLPEGYDAMRERVSAGNDASPEPDNGPLEEKSAASTPLGDLLGQVKIASEFYPTPYDRRDWLPVWGPASPGDKDGLANVRHEVLRDQSSCAAVIQPGRTGNVVVAGCWRSMYDGTDTTDPKALEVDHIVALAEAHRSGGASWDILHKRKFANDLESHGGLLAVSSRSNQDKSDSDPAEWMPPDESVRCAYLVSWVALKLEWDLTMDREEYDAVRAYVPDCTSADGLLALLR